MCVGIPMRVLEIDGPQALCEGGGRRELVNILLIETPKVGDWLLVFLGSAREILTPEQAADVNNALAALDLALKGESSFDHLFPDLAGRTPELPDFLNAPALPKEAAGCEAALSLLEDVRAALADAGSHKDGRVFDLGGLDAANRAFIGQTLGEGEVSIIAGPDLQAQEAVLAGVWRLQSTGREGGKTSDTIVVGAFPKAVLDLAASGAAAGLDWDANAPLPPGIANAPALLTETGAALTGYAPGKPPHVINLSLLPHTEGDLAFLVERLGRGQVTVLSRGYGDCRISSTGTANVWWVQYFNSRDALILNSLEIVDVPEVACAAPEDLADSAERLAEILRVFK